MSGIMASVTVLETNRNSHHHPIYNEKVKRRLKLEFLLSHQTKDATGYLAETVRYFTKPYEIKK